MNDLQKLFDYKGQQIRIVMYNDEPWFVAKDVCEVLEITWNGSTLERIATAHKGLRKISTPGGEQELKCVDEPGLYKLINRSNKPEAEKFSDWIYEDILPTIRKTGNYIAKPMTSAEMLLAQAQIAVEHEKKIQELEITGEQHEQRITTLEEAHEKKADLIEILPPVQQKSLRANITQIVRGWAVKNSNDFRGGYGNLYKEFKYRYRIDLKIRAKHRNVDAMDVAEELGMLPDLLTLAVELYA